VGVKNANEKKEEREGPGDRVEAWGTHPLRPKNTLGGKGGEGPGGGILMPLGNEGGAVDK